MAFCPNCGSQVDPGVAACAKCGGQTGASAPAAAPSPVYVTAPSPNSFQSGAYQPGYTGMPLPDPSPMALIMAAGSWAICGPLLSVPAVIKARSDIAGIREGRYNPNSMSMCQIAFWVGAVNAGLYLALFLLIGVLFAFGFFVAATAPHHTTISTSPTRTPAPVRAASVRPYESVESDVERLMAARPESERKIWRQTREDLRVLRRQKGTGLIPEAKGLTELLRIAESDLKLRSALVELEQKAAEESGREAPPRVMPAEAPGQGSPK